MKAPKIRKRLIELGLLFTYRVLLDVVYAIFVCPFYEYANFVLQPNIMKIIESYFLLFLFLFFLPPGERKPSAAAMKYLFILMIVPLLSFYALSDAPRSFTYLVLSGFVFTLSIIRFLPAVRIKRIERSTPILFIGLGVFSLLGYALFIRANGMPTLRALRLLSIYELRSAVSYSPAIMNYLIPWQAKVINPFLMVFACYKRKYLILLLSLGLQFLLFLMTGARFYLLSLFLILFLVYSVKRQSMFRLSLVGLIAVILLSFIVYAAGGPIIVPSMIIRRVFFVPAKISFDYYDFFSRNELMYLSESRLGKPFFENPYETYGMRSANMMGMIYANSPETNMNTGYIGDAYMNFGGPGIWLFSLILGGVLLLSDSISRNTHRAVVTVFVVWTTSSLVNSGLPTTMLTHGLLAAMLVIWLYKEKSWKVNGQKEHGYKSLHFYINSSGS